MSALIVKRGDTKIKFRYQNPAIDGVPLTAERSFRLHGQFRLERQGRRRIAGRAKKSCRHHQHA
jgi:hypothetical protein